MKYHNRGSEISLSSHINGDLLHSFSLTRTVPIRSGTSRSLIVRLVRLTDGVMSVTLRGTPRGRRQALRDGAVFTHRCGTVAIL